MPDLTRNPAQVAASVVDYITNSIGDLGGLSGHPVRSGVSMAEPSDPVCRGYNTGDLVSVMDWDVMLVRAPLLYPYASNGAVLIGGKGNDVLTGGRSSDELRGE